MISESPRRDAHAYALTLSAAERAMKSRGTSDLEQILDRLDGGAEVFVDVHLILHRLAGVQHSGVILAADHLADARKGSGGVLLGQVHGDLARLHDLALA